MRIFTFFSADAPPTQQGLARFWDDSEPAKNKWSPVVIHASTEEIARAKAEAWLQQEMARIREREHYAKSRNDRLAAARKVKSEIQVMAVPATSKPLTPPMPKLPPKPFTGMVPKAKT